MVHIMKLLFAVCCTAALLWTPARADEATKNAKVEELLKLSKADQMMTQIADQMKAMSAAQLGKTDMSPEARKAADEMTNKITALIRERWDKMRPQFVKVYADTYTEEELDGIVAFYKSPAGQAMLTKMPDLMKRSMALAQEMVSDVAPEVQKIATEAAAKANQQK